MKMTTSLVRLGIAAVAPALISLMPSAAGAQVLEAGARVRITEVSGTRHPGSFEALGADSIRVTARGESIAVPLSAVAGLEISTGKHRRFWQNFVLAAGAVAMLGGATMAATHEPCDVCIAGPESRGEAFAWGAAAGGVVGAPFGVLAGAAIRHERWVPVYHPAVRPLRVSIHPVLGNGVGLAGAVTVR